jgi:hypothetical protein
MGRFTVSPRTLKRVLCVFCDKSVDPLVPPNGSIHILDIIFSQGLRLFIPAAGIHHPSSEERRSVKDRLMDVPASTAFHGGRFLAANETATVQEDGKLQISILILVAIIFGLLVFGIAFYFCCCQTSKNKRKIDAMMQEAKLDEEG